MVKDFFKNWIVKNLSLTILAVGVLVAVAIVFLNLYTRHGKELQVPDFYGMDLEQAEAVAALSDLRVEVADSIYVNALAPGAVYRQLPKAGSGVKKGRRVLLTINATQPKTVIMPDLIGFSMRQARAELSSIGLNTGKLVYREDIATNNVLGQKYQGRDIKPGTRIYSGSTVDLVLGLNPADNGTYIPDLLGMNCYNAMELLQESSLNIGRTVYDETVRNGEDSVKAVVYRQIPEPSEYPLNMGADVIIYLTTDHGKIKARSVADSLDMAGPVTDTL